MKKLLFTVLFLGFCFVSIAQNEPKVGDVLVVNEPYAQTFNYINFPKPNILIKRGKVANYNSIYGNKVIIDDIKTKDDGNTYVILKKQDGSKFFGYLNSVKANYKKAITSKELKAL